jgi:hypothetical protein
MVRTQVYIPEDLYSQAKLLAKSKNQTISQILRMGLSQMVSQQKKSKKRSLRSIAGSVRWDGPVVDAARTHNDIYDLQIDTKEEN